MKGFLTPFSEARKMSKNSQINGFRSLLCALVVAYHLGALFFVRFAGVKALPSYLPNLVIMVVGIFYLLSGFFLSYKGAWDFFKGKALRIYVPFVFTTLFVFFICFYSGYPNYISYPQMGLNLLLFPYVLGRVRLAAGNLWFVAYLMVFYLVYGIFNLLAFPWRKKVNIVPLLMLVYAIVVFLYPVWTWNETTLSSFHRVCNALFLGHYRCYLFLFLGYFLRLAYDAYQQKENRWWGRAALSVAVLLLAGLYGRIFIDDGYHWSALILFLALAVLGALALFNRLPFLAKRPFQIVGSSSLWVYMIHENVGYLIIWQFYKISANLYWIGLVLAVLYAFGFGIFLQWGYEKLLSLLPQHSGLHHGG